MNKILAITLKSDLCAATGDGFSAGMDTDACFDKAGLPYIPARRIKGCLREAAVEIGCEDIEAIFGAPGKPEAGSLRVGNAEMLYAKEIRTAAKYACLEAAAVTELFTQVRAQTEIEDDSVKDGSLRFTRVVGHYSPLDQSELIFEAPVTFDEAYEEQMKRIAKALRAIGYKRNRGFGAIRCTLEEATASDENATGVKRFKDGIAYAVYLEEPLMLPQQGDSSLAYVPGSAVLGYFAGKIAKKCDSATFEELILKDKLHFSPLYPVSDGNRAIPAFGLIAKIKGAKADVRDGEMVSLYGAKLEPGEQPKPCKSGFLDAKGFYGIDVATEIIYHHSTGKATGDDATLYTQECLSEGQVLAGFVKGPKEALGLIEEILGEGHMSLGRSKAAQYSRCTVSPYEGVVPTDSLFEANGPVLALLDEDALIDNGRAGYAQDAAALAQAIANAAGLGVPKLDESPYGSVKHRVISGYNAKWNQKKPHVRAFAAGSFLVFDGDGLCPSEVYVGERQAEGLGRVLLMPVENVRPRKAAENNEEKIRRENLGTNSRWAELLQAAGKRERLRAAALEVADGTRRYNLNTSFVGRVLRMVEQAKNRADLDARIASIKSDAKRKAAQEIVKDARAIFENCPWSREQEALCVLFNCMKYRAKAEGGKDE